MNSTTTLPSPHDNDWTAFDEPTLVQRYVQQTADNASEMVLSVEGISCSGCVAKIETRLRDLPGIRSIQINPSTRRALVSWEQSRLAVSDVLAAFARIGYPARPYAVREQEKRVHQERRKALTRIMLAAALGMQVMMITTALYFGDALGMEERHRSVLRFTAMIMTLPVLLFAARPFFTAAIRDLRHGTVGIDVPVSLALTVAFTGSVLATFGFPGHVYYESIVMFTGLLLVARYLELVARQRSMSSILAMEKSIPETARRIDANGREIAVDVDTLVPGDRVNVASGQQLPADGTVIAGTSSVDESILTGESAPVEKRPGDTVVAGSVNVENALTVEVRRSTRDNVVSRLVQLTEQAQSARPRAAVLADFVAGRFVAGVLVLATIAGVYWWFADRTQWLPVVISTLVIACPCALSLATPTAFVAMMGALTRRGILPLTSDFLEKYPAIDHVVFDKTGTLTHGTLSLAEVTTAPGWSRDRALALACALNRESRHPLANALRRLAVDDEPVVTSLEHTPGGGVTARHGEDECLVGSDRFLAERGIEPGAIDTWASPNGAASYCLLASAGEIVARFEFQDRPRDEAAAVIAALEARGISVSLLSGDAPEAVAAMAAGAGIEDWHARLSPAEKLAAVEALQREGKHVAVVGDGLNDAPVLARGDVSFAMGQGADLAKISADVVLLNDRLTDLIELFDHADRTRAVVRQNFAWAIGYNLLALPAAVIGMVPPWLAALGMCASSLVVSLNALRLLRSPGRPSSSTGTEPTAPTQVAPAV